MNKISDEISLRDTLLKFKDLYRYLKTKWLILVIVGIVGGIVGFIYATFQKPIYTASITYALDDEKGGGGIGGALGLANSLGFDVGASAGGAFGSTNLMELMHSRNLIEKTLLSEVYVNGIKMTLAEFYIDVNELRSKWLNKPELLKLHYFVDEKRENFTRIQDSVLGIIYSALDKNQLSITQKDKKVTIGLIEVQSINENFAKLFCETLAKQVTELYIETKSLKARNNVIILQKQVDSVRQELNNAITGVAAANDNVFNLNSALTVKRTNAAKRQVDVQANTAILTQLVANLEMAKVSLLKETPLIQIIDKPILPLKKEKVGRLKSLILGCFLASFLTILFLVFRRIGKSIMED